MADARASWGAACCAPTQTGVGRSELPAVGGATLWTHTLGHPRVFSQRVGKLFRMSGLRNSPKRECVSHWKYYCWARLIFRFCFDVK